MFARRDGRGSGTGGPSHPARTAPHCLSFRAGLRSGMPGSSQCGETCFPIPLCAYAEVLALLAGNGWTSAGLISHLRAGPSLSRAPWLDEDGSQGQRMVGSRYLDRDLIAVDAGHFAAQHDGITHFHFRRHDRPPGSIEAAAWYEGNSAFRQNHMLRDIGQGQGKSQGRGDSYHQHGLCSVTKERQIRTLSGRGGVQRERGLRPTLMQARQGKPSGAALPRVLYSSSRSCFRVESLLSHRSVIIRAVTMGGRQSRLQRRREIRAGYFAMVHRC